MRQSIVSRSVQSVKWNVASNIVTVIVGFIKTIWLARLLPVEVFGIYALSHSIMSLTKVVSAMGFDEAFLNRSEETQDEAQAAGVFLNLRLILTSIWAILLLSGAWIIPINPQLRLALVVVTLANAVVQLTQPISMILVRRVKHRRLAIIQILNSTLASVLAISFALMGWGIWALLISPIVNAVVDVVLLYIWQPIWKPRLIWNAKVHRYYFGYGLTVMYGRLLLLALDHIDDIWTGVFLGNTALGFYTQAYTLATYPRLIIARPIIQVVAGTYAELRNQPKRLSQAFLESNRLMIRMSFLFAGGLALVAPEFIRLLLGEKWLPMTDAVRFMLLFTMLHPIRETTASLFTGIGKPGIVVTTRLIQLVALVLGLFVLGTFGEIVGVALAVDIMMIFGIGHMLWHARKFVTFSVTGLFLVPFIALLGGIAAGHGIQQVEFIEQTAWLLLVFKTIAFTAIYLVIWFGFERETLLKLIRIGARTQQMGGPERE